MLPTQPAPPPNMLPSSPPPTSKKASSCSPEDVASDVHAHLRGPQHTSQQAKGNQLLQDPRPGFAPVKQCHDPAVAQEVGRQGQVASCDSLGQGVLVEPETGQAVAEATVELVLAVLQGSEDTGPLRHCHRHNTLAEAQAPASAVQL